MIDYSVQTACWSPHNHSAISAHKRKRWFQKAKELNSSRDNWWNTPTNNKNIAFDFPFLYVCMFHTPNVFRTSRFSARQDFSIGYSIGFSLKICSSQCRCYYNWKQFSNVDGQYCHYNVVPVEEWSHEYFRTTSLPTSAHCTGMLSCCHAVWSPQNWNYNLHFPS